MREAMYRAEVGDDVYRDDPTVNRLEEEAAQILGTEAALFVSSGTMGNQLGIMVYTHRGDEVIAGAESHIFTSEVGGAAVLSGANIRQMVYPNSIPVPALIEGAIRTDDIHDPPTSLICLENALANGRVVPLEVMEGVSRVAKAHKLPVHLDGARIFNAAVSLGCEAKDIMRYCDSVSLPFQALRARGACSPRAARRSSARASTERCSAARQAGILAAAARIAITEMPNASGRTMRTPAIWPRASTSFRASRPIWRACRSTSCSSGSAARAPCSTPSPKECGSSACSSTRRRTA